MTGRGIPRERVIEKLDELLSRNDYEAAREHLLFWLSEAEKSGDDGGILLLCNELMGLCRKLGERERALFYAKSALGQIEKMGIEENTGAATTYLNSATVFKAFSMAEKALPLFEKAKAIYDRNLPPDDERNAGLYNNTALCLVDLKRFAEADEFYKRALEVLRLNSGKEPEQAVTYLNMASAAEAKLGLLDAAEQIAHLCEKAMELLDSCQALGDGNYAFVCEKCASTFGYYGYFDYERQLKERARRIYEGT